MSSFPLEIKKELILALLKYLPKIENSTSVKLKSGTVATKVTSYDDKEGLLRRNHS